MAAAPHQHGEAAHAVPEVRLSPTPDRLGPEPEWVGWAVQKTWDTQFDPFAILSAVRDQQGQIIDLRFAAANRAAVEYHDMPRSQLVGATLLELYPRLLTHGPMAAYLQTAATGTPTVLRGYQYDNERLGQPRRYDIRAVQVGDGIALTWRDVTESYRDAAELAASQQTFRLLAENASDVVYQLDDRGFIQWVSPSVTEQLGWQPDDLLGRRPSSFVHPEDVTTLGAPGVTPGQVRRTQAEVRVAAKGGGYRWMAASTRPLARPDGSPAGHAGALRDIAAEVAGRQALQASEGLFRTAIDSAAIGMALVGPDGRFQVANYSLRRLVGRPDSWFVDHRMAELDHPEDAEIARRERDLMLPDSPPLVSETRLLRSDGQVIWVRQAGVMLAASAAQPQLLLLQFQDVTAERWAREELAFRAFHDPLTGLRNRSWLMDMLDLDLQSAARTRTQVAVLFFDIENFKLINDSLGHAAGDRVLTELAQRLTSRMEPAGRVARFSGDVFVVVLPDVRDPLDVERTATALHAALSAHLMIDGIRISTSAAVGIAMSGPLATPESLLRDSEAALHQAQLPGQRPLQFADPAMHDLAMARIRIEDELRLATAGSQFTVHYQPIVSTRGGQVVGYEALARWQHPSRGLLLPQDFLAVAEESGQVVGVGRAVLEAVCARLAATPASPPISINVSAVELRQADWLEQFQATLDRHHVDPEQLIVEVTETAILSLGPDTQAHLEGLRQLGVGIHVDDFGTGYSSLSLLQDVPLTGLKLDARFVRGLSRAGGPANAIASGLWVLARELKLTGVAEGVQYGEQAKVIADIGWPAAQGFHFGQPSP